MKEQAYSQYALFHNRYYKITMPATTIVAFIILLLIDRTCQTDFVFREWHANQVQLYWEMIPVMLLTFLSGYSTGPLVVLLFFTVKTMGRGLAYHCFMLLAASLVMNIPIYHRWFLSIFKTILADILMVALFGPGWNMLLRILQGAEIVPQVEVVHFFVAAPSCTIVCLFCYCYHRFLPQKIKDLFVATATASDYMVEFRRKIKEQNRPKISTKLTVMVVGIVGILLISAYGISISLFSEEMRRMLLQTSDGLQRHIQQEAGGVDWIDWKTIIFATRMFVLMTIIAIPAVLVAISSTNSMITSPLVLMTMAVENSSGKASASEKAQIDIHKLDIRNRDEIGILYGALVHSYDVLNEYLKNLEREKQLSDDLAVAKEAARAKDSFLSSMSHEIRTPINAVLGLDEMIIRETKEEEIRNYAVDIQTAGKNLLSIVNEILDFSKIGAGKMEIIPVEYDLSSTINDLTNMISKRAEDKGLELRVNVDENIPYLLFGDEIRIKQCVLNILTNAVKYTEKGSVTMTIDGKRLSAGKIALTFHVIDTGIGIKEEDLPKLYTAFQRIEEERNRTIEGTGLGMSIVQQLLGLMGTHLDVKSVYGKGSDFYFTIEQKVMNWEPIGNFIEAYKKTQKTLATYTEAFHAPQAHVLVTDDTTLNLTVAKGLLKQTEVQVDTAESGARTLDLVCRKKYDIIFLDHRMPVMDGIETLQAMEHLDGNLNIGTPVIALTANAIAGAREMYLEAGFTDYLTKPIDSKKLEAMLVMYLPKDKIERVSTDTAANGDASELANERSEVSDGNDESEKILQSLTGVDVKAAVSNCGGAGIFLEVARDFYNAIDQKSALIQQYFEENDWKNYTVLVHALKSSARLIGATELSEQAARLERCGDVADGKIAEEKAGLSVADANAEITEKTPGLIALFRDYKQHLLPLAGEQDSGEKEPISEEDFAQALGNIKECVEAFDFNTADSIISMLDGYKIPGEQAERYRQIKEKIAAVDQAAVLELL